MAEEKIISDDGANSIAYKTVIDGKDFIIKTCRNPQNLDAWLFCAKKEAKMLAMLHEKNNLSADIPTMKIINNQEDVQIVQSAIQGEFLTPEIYKNCSPSEKDKIAKDLAQAMYTIHNLDMNEIAQVTNDGYIPQTSPDRENSDKYFKRNYNKYIEALRTMVKPQTVDAIDNFIKNTFNRLENVNTHVAPIHNDIRYSNIFYDKKNQKLGIIDFGSCEVNDVYHDFASIGLPNSLGFELQKDVINHYNQLLKENHKDYQLSPETAKAYSVARMVYLADMMQRSDKVKKTLFPNTSSDKIVGMEDYLAAAGVISVENSLERVRKKLYQSQSYKNTLLLQKQTHIAIDPTKLKYIQEKQSSR